MIIDSFDCESKAIINPKEKEKKVKCDVVIVTFSHEIEKYVLSNFRYEEVGEFCCVTGNFKFYTIKYKGKIFGFYKTILGSSIAVGMLEDISTYYDCSKYLVFGSAGVLDKTCERKVVVPTFAYRDEGTSYHYAKAEDYIEIKNAKMIINFMKKYNIPYKSGKCWTTDGFYRETENNLRKRQNDGCVAVDMECSAIQAFCNFRNLDLFYFFLSGDLLDAPEWDDSGLKKANHNFENFNIALHLAYELTL